MPRVLLVVVVVSHKAFFESSLFQVADEVPVAARALLNATSSPCSARSAIGASSSHIGRRWVVGRAGLQADRLARVEVAGHALNGCRNATLLLLHCRCSLSGRSHGSLLLVHAGIRHLGVLTLRDLLWPLRHDHRSILSGLLTVARRHIAVTTTRRVNVVVGVYLRLDMARLAVLSSGHVRALGGRVCLRLCCLRPLLAKSFGLLLLLGSWGRRPVEGTRLEVHGRHKRTGKLLLRDERVQLGLLGRPSLERVDCQEATNEIDEGYPVVHFWGSSLANPGGSLS